MVDYVKEVSKNDDDLNINMVSNMHIYKYKDSKTNVPMFFKNIKIPNYINGEMSHVVKDREVNRIDNISYKYYGTPELYWVIMLVNNLLSPFDIKNGDVLRILPYDYIKYNIFRYKNEEDNLF